MTQNQAYSEHGLQGPLRTLILTDGKMGDLAPCRGVAEALGAQITEIEVHPGKLAATLGQVGRDPGFKTAVAALSAEPHVIVASGRRAAPYLKSLKHRFGSRTLTVFLKDPRTGTSAADLIWVPAHDQLRGANVCVTDTAPHSFTDEPLRQAGAALRERLSEASYPRPWLGVMLGGATRHVPYDQRTVADLKQAIAQAGQAAGAIIVTPSRRTPDHLLAALEGLHDHLWVWDGIGENPYAGMLGACEAFLVTGDSHNMVSEVLAAGRHTIVFRPAGLPHKFVRFLDTMAAKKLIAPPGLADFDHHQPPVDATPVIAAAIREQLAQDGIWPVPAPSKT